MAAAINHHPHGISIARAHALNRWALIMNSFEGRGVIKQPQTYYGALEHMGGVVLLLKSARSSNNILWSLGIHTSGSPSKL